MKADSAEITRLVRTARGQLDGVLKMIEDGRYCVDISNQLLAATAVIKKANREIIRAHLGCCVRDAIGSDDAEQKIAELISLMEKL